MPCEVRFLARALSDYQNKGYNLSPETHSQLANFIWSICNLLRGPYKRNEYRKVMSAADRAAPLMIVCSLPRCRCSKKLEN